VVKLTEATTICRTLFSENKTIIIAKKGIVAMMKPRMGNKTR
jgi:hypothetical protein